MRRCSNHNDYIDKAFDALLSAAFAEYKQKQAEAENSLSGFSTWHHDMANCEIEFRAGLFKKLRYRTTVIGTFLPSAGNWCWGWANDGLSEAVRNGSALIKALTNKTQYKIFSNPYFDIEIDEIDELCALALYELGGKSVFKIKNEEPWLFLILH